VSSPDFVVCYIEGKQYPRAACHRHHLDPRHAGGSDDSENLAWLSATAHQLVHRAAQMIKAKKHGHAQDLAMSAYPSPAMRQRFMAVVQSEVEHSVEAKEQGKGKSTIIVEVPFPRDEYARLKLLVADRRAGGKKMSIHDYIARLVMNHVRSTGG